MAPRSAEIDFDLRDREYARKEGLYPIGVHQHACGAMSAVLPIREVFMMALMDRLTDKPDWHKKVFKDHIVAKWRNDALQQSEDGLWAQVIEGKSDYNIPQPTGRVLSEAAFDFIVRELRGKAKYAEKTGLVHTLDSDGNTVVKSDVSVPADLHNELNAAVAKLHAHHAANIDWHPGSNDMVQDLVHPSMYPLAYGRSTIFRNNVVGVTDAVQWAGKGETLGVPTNAGVENAYFSVPPEYWSDKYQWLPANLAFQEDGCVRFTSYINNLHPTKYPDIYRTIERLVDRAIPAWDQCLAKYVDYKKNATGRKKSRFSLPKRCQYVHSAPSHPVTVSAHNHPSRIQKMQHREQQTHLGL